MRLGELAAGVIAWAKDANSGATIDTDGKPMTKVIFGDASATLHTGHEIKEAKAANGKASSAESAEDVK